MERIANRDASSYVRRRQEFKGSNLFGAHIGDRYVVYSYGAHWPMFIHVDGTWFENQDKYSRTTSKQKGQAHPGAATTKLSTEQMVSIAQKGVVGHVVERMVA